MYCAARLSSPYCFLHSAFASVTAAAPYVALSKLFVFNFYQYHPLYNYNQSDSTNYCCYLLLISSTGGILALLGVDYLRLCSRNHIRSLCYSVCRSGGLTCRLLCCCLIFLSWSMDYYSFFSRPFSLVCSLCVCSYYCINIINNIWYLTRSIYDFPIFLV